MATPPPSPNPPASRPIYWTSSMLTSADPAGSPSEIPCAKNMSRRMFEHREILEQLAASDVPAQPVDRAPPRGGGDPAARVRWQAVPRPEAKRQRERILDRVLGDLDLPEDPDQGGHGPAGLLAEDPADRGLIHTRRCVAGPVDAVSVAYGPVCHAVRPAWCPRRGGPRSACR